ncbi:DUF3012 domain-containing protein [Alkalilimnicola ehrlichii MLHE-1]|uniref:DUF3012 domain-containing protein n=1 Tax=Alkalilimnicola ehrlichii (strain ATCC BAA-1101 / DSM 17681 / MLHE-1) TaxID=187272 RepID=Q0A543_ALKEH|nr:DUF3012 domain-containing protein [Alkalilimnicola ehrlichii]ABI58044.1 hypothetical protein Mlg_2704 [Alkalilimnicola ehrlichii MLHE-1]
MQTPRVLLFSVLFVLLLMGCGNEQSADDDAAPLASNRPALEASAVADLLVQNFHDQTAIFEEIGDRILAIDGQAAAEEVGRLLEGAYTDRAIAGIEDMVQWAEEYLVPLDAAERAVLAEELDAIFAADGRLKEAGMRLDRATERVDGSINALFLANPGQAQTVLNGVIAFGENLEAFMNDERWLALDRLLAPEPAPEDAARGSAGQIGSPTWCERMANTPQSQWTMNDAFAFANHCTGG